MTRETLRQDKETGKWIDKAAWHEKYGPDDVVRKTAGNYIPDIDPYISPLDGQPVNTRPEHNRKLREHGCVEVGTENIESAKAQLPKKDDGTKAVKQAVIDAYNQSGAS